MAAIWVPPVRECEVRLAGDGWRSVEGMLWTDTSIHLTIVSGICYAQAVRRVGKSFFGRDFEIWRVKTS